jgi:hypothetical protein
MTWLKENWDKIAAIILSGLVGFFTAIMTVKDRQADLQRDLAKVQTTLDGLVVPKMQTLDAMNTRVGDFSRELTDFQKQNALSIQTNNFLQLMLMEERKRTANDLRDILNDDQLRNKKPAALPAVP